MTTKFCCVCLEVDRWVMELVKSDYKRFIEKIFLENNFHQILCETFYICSECMALLEKSYKFVQKALTAQKALTELWQLTSEITLEDINAINRKKLGLISNLSRHGPIIVSYINKDEKKEKKDTFLKVHNVEKAPCVIDELCENEKQVNKDTFLPANDDEEEPGVIDELYEGECKVEIQDLSFVDPFENIEVELEAASDKKKSNITSDTASRNDVADNELKTHNIKHSASIIKIEDSTSENCSNNIVANKINQLINVTKINKIAKQLQEDPDFELKLSCKEGQKSIAKRKTTDCNPPQAKENIKKVRLRYKDYVPSAFMLSLSSMAEKRKRRNKEKYVYSDESDDGSKRDEKIDDEFKPASSNSSENDSEDSMYDRYDDLGRRLKKPADRNYPMPCDHCNAEIPAKREHYRHYLIAHPKIEYPYRTKSLNLLCQYCGYVARRSNLYNEHLLTHSAESAFPCSKCPKRFKNRIRLNNHEKNTHPNVLLECDYCGKKSKVKSDLVLHIRTHTGEKPFKCHICGAGFAHKGNVGIHIRSVHQGLSQQTKTKTKINIKRGKIRKTQTENSEEQEPLTNTKERKIIKAKPKRQKRKSK